MAVSIPSLFSGGLITNYYCTSRCRHCAYFSSPKWEKQYIKPETARESLALVKGAGCRSLHVGGGEPFLHPEGLSAVLDEFRSAGMGLDYVETNSSWFRDAESARTLLSGLRKQGLTTILVSISPFHNEYIPFEKIDGVMAAARKAGVGVFPWVDGFLADLKRFDRRTTHSLEEYESVFGEGYISRIPERYWVSFRGRALQTYKAYMTSRPLRQILDRNRGPCRELFDTSHFHVDLFGCYIPGLCTGLSIRTRDIDTPLGEKEYPFIVPLMERGISGLLEIAEGEYGFIPAESYVSKCELCYEIRKFLVLEKGVDSPDLKPVRYYESV
jgi:hypothetical protein